MTKETPGAGHEDRPCQDAAAIRAARLRRGWSQARLAYEMRKIAKRQGTPLPAPESLRKMISRWERGQQNPEAYNRAVLAAALGIKQTPARVLRRARRRLGWTQRRLTLRMREIARARKQTLPTPDSLESMISRWENGRGIPDRYNRVILCAALQINESDLGIPPDEDDES